MVGGDNRQLLSTHKYSGRALAGDYFRTSIGVVLVAGPLLLVELNDVLRVILFLLSVIFLIFGVRTMVRQATTVTLFDQAIRSDGGRWSRLLGRWLTPTIDIPWPHMAKMTLKYFSTRRDREAGWMQLTLAGPDSKLSLDSAVDGFDRIVAQAVKAAGENKLVLAHTTLENLHAMGLAPTSNMSPDFNSSGNQNGDTTGS